MPSWPISSSRPTKGLTKVAPALAASSACAAEKHSVTLVIMPCSESARQARSPSGVSGSFTVTFAAMRVSTAASRIIWLYSVAATSALTGPGTTSQISATTSRIRRPDLAISEGLVVTPSSRPEAASALISADIRGIDEKLHLGFPGAVSFTAPHWAGVCRGGCKSGRA